MGLSERDITEILTKIRSEYNIYSKENPKAFDLHGFEKRYLQAMQMKMNTTRFLNDEVAFLEQLKSKHNEMKAKKEASKGQTINRIMDEAIERLSKYQKIDFHPLVKSEVRYFYGAMRDFGDSELPTIIHIFRGTPEFREYQDAVHTLERVCIQRGNQPSPRMIEHIKSLLDANGNQTLMEKDAQEVLRSGCLALKKIADLNQEMLEKNYVSSGIKVQLDESEYRKAAETYNRWNHREAIENISKICNEIIDDFRMRSIVQ